MSTFTEKVRVDLQLFGLCVCLLTPIFGIVHSFVFIPFIQTHSVTRQQVREYLLPGWLFDVDYVGAIL